MNTRTAFILLFALIVISCSKPQTAEEPKLTEGEGYAQLQDGNVWYRVVGKGDKAPILLLHGGPGVPSFYLNPLAALGKDRPVIFLDQLGCGRSDREISTDLMTIESFVEQLEEFISLLEIEEFYLYGQSWGTMLGVDYYLEYPDKIKGMILSSPALSAKMWSDDAKKLIETLEEPSRQTLRDMWEGNPVDSAAGAQAGIVFYENFVARKLPWDANIDSAFAQMNADVYNTMWGPSEFVAQGNLKNYDRTGDLNRIKVPTLFICGEYDEATPETTGHYASLVTNSQFQVIENAAHITMHDNPNRDIEVISNFLNEIEN